MAVNFIAYLRVSTTRQGEHGLGIDAQREAVRRYVEQVHGILIEEHVEVETGRSTTRPILLKSIARCKASRSTLLIARIDRLARSVSFISSLMDGGVDFIATDMPQANRLILHLLAAFAEFERDQIAARTKAALAAAKARGVVLGSYGRQLADRQIADATSFAERLRLPVEAVLNGGRARLQDVADALNEAGYTTREGARWSPTGVHRILRRLDLKTSAMAPALSNRVAGKLSCGSAVELNCSIP